MHERSDVTRYVTCDVAILHPGAFVVATSIT